MATTAIDEPPLNERQRKNKAQQLPQTGLDPLTGIAHLAGDAGAAVQAGAESMQRGLEQQGRALSTVARGAADAINRGDPVKDAALAIGGGIAAGWDATKEFFSDSAALARTGDYGQMVPGDRGGPDLSNRLVLTQPAGQQPTPAPPTVPQPATPAQRAGVGASARTAIDTPAGFRSTDVTRGTATGGAPQPPAAQAAPASGITGGIPNRTVTIITPEGQSARAQANQMLNQASSIMAGDNGIGGGIVASGLRKQAKGLTEIDAAQRGADVAQQNAGNAARNTDIAAFDAMSKDEDRRTDNAIKRDALEEKKRANKMREELASLDDTNDPGGKRRTALKAKLAVLSGREPDHFQPILGKDDLGNPMVLGVFNKQTGKMHDPAGQPIKSQNEVARAHADAKAAIERGMDPAEANRRLLSAGLPAL